MPSLFIKTNVARSKFPESFMSDMTKLLSESLGKPVKFINVAVEPDAWMVFAGTDAPCANCRLTCIGKLDFEDNVRHSNLIMTYLKENLGIDDDRMYIEFFDAARPNMGYKSTTFGALAKQNEKK